MKANKACYESKDGNFGRSIVERKANPHPGLVPPHPW